MKNIHFSLDFSKNRNWLFGSRKITHTQEIKILIYTMTVLIVAGDISFEVLPTGSVCWNDRNVTVAYKNGLFHYQYSFLWFFFFFFENVWKTEIAHGGWRATDISFKFMCIHMNTGPHWEYSCLEPRSFRLNCLLRIYLI